MLSLSCILYSAQGLVVGVWVAAKAGRLLPRLTLLLPVHAVIHLHWIDATLPNNNALSQCRHSDDVRYYECDYGYYRFAISISRYLLVANVTCCVLGYITLLLLYKHSVRTIFNRNIPHYSNDIHNSSTTTTTTTPRAPHPAIQSFNAHLLLLRPLEILFRFCTAPLRVLPDVIILGETRCGTTNLCAHLVQLSKLSSSQQQQQQRQRQRQQRQQRIKCYTPFCAWAVPELDHKESFYLVGHYCGIVSPYFYRMAFPLKLTRWFEECICDDIFICFDGCAQYLSSPTAPYLIATAYSSSGRRHGNNNRDTNTNTNTIATTTTITTTPPSHEQQQQQQQQQLPVLVACIREPVEQALSWFYYEKNAMKWGESMGLSEWNTSLRSTQYPPTTIASAVQYSMSDRVIQLYLNAENLVSKIISHDYTSTTTNTTRRIRRCTTTRILPSWAVTWPGGQLSVVGRSGNYAGNIQRYNMVFSEAAMEATDNNEATSNKKTATTGNYYLSNKIGHVHTIPIEYQSNPKLLRQLLRPILSDIIERRCATRKRVDRTVLMNSMNAALDNYIQQQQQQQNDDEHNNNIQQCRNSSTLLNIEHGSADTIKVDRAILSNHYKVESKWYAKLLQGLQYEKEEKKE